MQATIMLLDNQLILIEKFCNQLLQLIAIIFSQYKTCMIILWFQKEIILRHFGTYIIKQMRIWGSLNAVFQSWIKIYDYLYLLVKTERLYKGFYKEISELLYEIFSYFGASINFNEILMQSWFIIIENWLLNFIWLP